MFEFDKFYTENQINLWVRFCVDLFDGEVMQSLDNNKPSYNYLTKLRHKIFMRHVKSIRTILILVVLRLGVSIRYKIASLFHEFGVGYIFNKAENMINEI